jgi:hypothetical protein
MEELDVEIVNKKSSPSMPMELWLDVLILQSVMGLEIYFNPLELYSPPEEE